MGKIRGARNHLAYPVPIISVRKQTNFININKLYCKNSSIIHNPLCLLQERIMAANLIIDTAIENADDLKKYKTLSKPIV
jgi:hypothetical protein